MNFKTIIVLTIVTILCSCVNYNALNNIDAISVFERNSRLFSKDIEISIFNNLNYRVIDKDSHILFEEDKNQVIKVGELKPSEYKRLCEYIKNIDINSIVKYSNQNTEEPFTEFKNAMKMTVFGANGIIEISIYDYTKVNKVNLKKIEKIREILDSIMKK